MVTKLRLKPTSKTPSVGGGESSLLVDPAQPASSFDRWEIRTVLLATAISFFLGLAFVFIWSPLPFGWEGFDQYHDRALALARGEGFNTTDVPWGYVAFLAAFYRMFGDRPWIPLAIQALLNATMPFMTHRLARLWFDARPSAVAALLVGTFSFNTVYASTQSSDAVCNVLFLAGVTVFALGWQASRPSYACAAGGLLGLAPQFRPNLLLFPIALAALSAFQGRRVHGRVPYAAPMLALAIAINAPWTLRTYRLTGRVLPTSTHGAVQLWYATLEMGPYITGRTHNPRAQYETAPFPYSSVAEKSVIVTADPGNCPGAHTADLLFWTDRHGSPRRVPPEDHGGRLRFEIPAQPDPTTIYYRFVSHNSEAPVDPALEGGSPFVYFVSTDHLGDLDRGGDLLDVFDIARMVAHVTWGDFVPFADRLDADGDRHVTERDVTAAANALLWTFPAWSGTWLPPAADAVRGVIREGTTAVMPFADGSRFVVPRGFTRLTDLSATNGLARTMFVSTRPMASLAAGTPPAVAPCRALLNVAVNDAFDRRDVHQMQRYLALAMDNIRREPGAFAAASLYRAVRVFMITGSADVDTARQFRYSAMTYWLGRAVSAASLLLFGAGLLSGARRRRVPWLLLLPPAYVAATIAPFFATMRYAVTVQPFLFVVIAAAMAPAMGARLPVFRKLFFQR